ncbi:hypothetical protein [Microbulbifer agarilyticus]
MADLFVFFRKKFALCLLTPLLWLPAAAHAQCVTGGNGFAVCGLEGTRTVSYPSALTIPFTVESQSNSFFSAGNYRITVIPLDTSTFALFSGSQGADFSLSYTTQGSTTTQLLPNVPQGNYPGGPNARNASLTLTIIDPDTLDSGPYSGDFDFLIERYSIFGFVRSLRIRFTINLSVPRRIVVKNFDDLDLSTGSASAGQAIQGEETICVGGAGFARYRVQLSSQNGATGGAGAAPYLLTGLQSNMPYNPAFTNAVSATAGITPDSAGNIAGSFLRESGIDCTTDNATVIISIPASSWQQASEQTYTDTLTVTVTPE